MSAFDIQQLPPGLERAYIDQERNRVEDDDACCAHGIRWTQDCPECDKEMGWLRKLPPRGP